MSVTQLELKRLQILKHPETSSLSDAVAYLSEARDVAAFMDSYLNRHRQLDTYYELMRALRENKNAPQPWFNCVFRLSPAFADAWEQATEPYEASI